MKKSYITLLIFFFYLGNLWGQDLPPLLQRSTPDFSRSVKPIYYWEVVNAIKKVQVLPKGTYVWKEIQKGDVIYEGDTIKTGDRSSALLIIHGLDNQKSFMHLFERTELEVIRLNRDNIEKVPDVYLNILIGEIFINVKNLPQSSDFKVQTPTGEVQVRGTAFSIKVLLNKICRIVVMEGVLKIIRSGVSEVLQEVFIHSGKVLEESPSEPGQLKTESPEVINHYLQKSNELISDLEGSSANSPLNTSTQEQTQSSPMGYFSDQESIALAQSEPTPTSPIPEVDVEALEAQVSAMAAPIITTETDLPSGNEGIPYSTNLQARRGTLPYTWSLLSGALPNGLSLGANGVISGTPGLETVSVTPYTFTVEVRSANGHRSTKEFNLKINGYIEGTGWNAMVATGEPGAGYNNGWGNGNNRIMLDLLGFSGQLYGAVSNGVTGSEIWRSSDGANWTQINSGGFGDVNNGSVWALELMGGNIYGGTQNGLTGGEIWRSSDGSSWSQVNVDGFGDVNNIAIASLKEVNGFLYAGTSNSSTGGEIWRSSDGTSWSQVNVDGFGDGANTDIICFEEFGGVLYAGTRNAATGGEIWRSSDGMSWAQVNADGFGNSNNFRIESFVEHGNYFYAGTQNGSTGGEIWRSADGMSWAQVISGGFGDNNSLAFDSMITRGGYLYVSLRNYTTGVEIWCSSDGVSWNQVNTDGFADNTNWSVYCLYDWGNYIYAGVDNPSGLELWRFYSAYLDPLISGRVFDSETGEDIDSTVVSIYHYKDDALPVMTSSTNPYSVNVDDGVFYFRVEKEGYTFPSNISPSKTNGDHGELFAATGDTMTIDFPMDRGYPLEVIKRANKKQVVGGDIITFDISLRNLSALPLEELEIRDKMTNGFKLVEDSLYFNSTLLRDTQVEGRSLKIFPKTIPPYETCHISYQVRVGTGIGVGRYETTAYGWHCLRDWRMSNDSACLVSVVPDPLFTEGTVIGKVFHDKNQNGVQDLGEEGLPSVKVVTEKGIICRTDKDGKYHLSGILPGTHAFKVDRTSLPRGSFISTENPRVIHLTPALLEKVNFGVSFPDSETEVSSSENNSFFIVALGEGILRDIREEGNIEMAGENDPYEDRSQLDGTMSLYLKGKVKGKYLITASFDTMRGPGKYGETSYESRLFRNLDPDEYYPVYGDGGQIEYDADDTQDMLYLMVEWDESFAKWGMINTEIPLYNRSFQGGVVHYKSVGKTKFNDPVSELKAFSAKTIHQAVHDEILATGGSLYYLKNNFIVEGSEKVRVETKDPVSKETIDSYILSEEEDYEIDYKAGRILLKKALSSLNYNYSSERLASTSIVRGSNVYLVVDYEVLNENPFKSESMGIQAFQAIGNHVRVGGTYIEEDNERKYKLKGAQATIRVNESTSLHCELNRSEETLMENNRTLDGGLSFYSQGRDVSYKKSGDSLSLKGQTRIFKNLSINGSYTDQDPFFSSTGNTAVNGSKIYQGEVTYKPFENITCYMKHLTQKSSNLNVSSSNSNNRMESTSLAFDYFKNKWDYRLEYFHQSMEEEEELYSWNGSYRLNDQDLFAIRTGCQLSENKHVYSGGQLTSRGKNNDQVFIGTLLEINKEVSINLRETLGHLGDSTSLQIVKKQSKDSERTFSFQSGTNHHGKDYSQIGFGQSEKLGSRSRLYLKNDFSFYQDYLTESQNVGLETRFYEDLLGDFFYERSHILQSPTVINRDAISIGLQCARDGLSWNSRLEYRKDRGSERKDQWVTQNKLLFHVNENIETLCRLNYSETQNSTHDIREARFLESSLGFSYRPPNFDQFNLLSKYSFIIDENPLNRKDFFSVTEDHRHVIATEGIYDLNDTLQCTGKVAFRKLKERAAPRDWIKSDTFLYLTRLNYRFLERCELGAEYRVLSNRQIQDRKKGWLFEISTFIGTYMKVGMGYNFTDYEDDLRHHDDYSAKGWFLRMVGKY